MPFGRLHEEAAGDSKLLRLSNAAWRMWGMGLIYCQQNLSDGFIDADAIHHWGVRETNTQHLADVAKELCRVQIRGKAPLWSKVEGGYQVHNYLKWNDSRTTVMKLREQARDRMARLRGSREQYSEHSGEHGEEQGTNTVVRGSSSEKIVLPEKLRLHTTTVFPGGSLPREHLKHAACDPTFSRCVPEAVHAKLSNQLAPKHKGDRTRAAAALQAWYPTVWATLEADFVMPDAFKFWQSKFDADLSSGVPLNGKKSDPPACTVPNAEETAAYLRRQREGA